MTQEHYELLRQAALDATASGELEGIEFMPAMWNLLEEQSRGELTEAEFDHTVLELTNNE